MRKCNTCMFDLSIWSCSPRKACQKEIEQSVRKGYPTIGERCSDYCRVVGSDDDFVGDAYVRLATM